MQAGVSQTEIRLSAGGAAPTEAERHDGFWHWLFGRDVPDAERNWYGTNLREGRTAVSVLARDEADREQFTRILERPVEEVVNLRDERVVIEHRPVSGTGMAVDTDLPIEREIEVIERHEEPVAEKRAVKTEDVVVRKEANERTETVRDHLRETKVEVEKEPVEHDAAEPGRKP